MEHESQRRGVYIDHKMCCHGGKGCLQAIECIVFARKQTWCSSSAVTIGLAVQTVFKMGERSGRFRKNQARKTKIDTRDAVCTNAKKKGILEAGFERVECQEHNFHKRPIYLKKKTQTFPYAIASDFKALLGASKRPPGTKDLLFENEQVPASASLADTLNKEPEHVSSKDPEELIRKFREVLERRAAAI